MMRRKRTTTHNDDGDDDDCQQLLPNGQSHSPQEQHSTRGRLRYAKAFRGIRTPISGILSSLPTPRTPRLAVVVFLIIVASMVAAIIVFGFISIFYDNASTLHEHGMNPIGQDSKGMDSKIRISRKDQDNKREFQMEQKSDCKKIPVTNDLLEPYSLFSGEAKRFRNSCNHSSVVVAAAAAADGISHDGEGRKSINAKKRNKRDGALQVKTVEIVVAYCQEDLNWIYKDVIDVISPRLSTVDAADISENHGVKKIRLTIMSKCGKESLVPDFAAQDSRIDKMSIVLLPNVGGCDFAYVHFINRYMEQIIGRHDSASLYDYKNTVILFIKGSMRSPDNFHFPHHERYRGVDEMLDLSFHGEFGCGIKTTCDVSPYHDTATLNRFTIKAYSRISDIQNNHGKHVQEDGMNALGYKNLGDFHRRALNWTFPNHQLTLVCYGGTFAIPAERIVNLSRDQEYVRLLQNLEKALSRSSSAKVAVEEHFAERTWAGIFAEPLSLEHTNIVKSYQTSIIKRRFSIFGPLQSDHFHQKDICFP